LNLRFARLAHLALAALLLGLVSTEPAAAFSRKVQMACKADYKRLCPQYKTGTPQLRACMEAKAGEISGNCISALMDEGVVDRRRASR
jgi:hypothetical protein